MKANLKMNLTVGTTAFVAIFKVLSAFFDPTMAFGLSIAELQMVKN